MPVSCPSCRASIAQTPAPPRCPECSSPLRGPEPKLVIRLPGGVTTEFVIRDRLSLGRNPQRNNICISDREVSKEHAVVDRRGNDVVITDLGSSNGTHVNEVRIKEPRLLKDGDVLRLGATQIVYMAAELAPAPITLGGAANPVPGGARMPSQSGGRANLTVVHSFNAPVLAQVKASTERNLKPVAEFEDTQQLREEYERLRIAAAFQEKIKLDKGPDVLLEQILQFAHTTLKADNGAILMRTDDGFEASHIKQRGAASGTGFTVSDTLLEQVTTTRSALLIQDVDVDPRFSAAQSIVSQGIKCAMGVPLITKGSVRAVLYLDILQRTHSFTDTDLKLLNAIAIQAAYTLENAELVAQVEQEATTRRDLSRFLPPQLVEQAQQGAFDLAPKDAEITVLFSDIRGFTAMSEKEKPETVVSMLNEYFEQMVEVVFQYGGTLDKFIGDALMALWGSPTRREDDAENAVRAALEMQRRMVAFNRSRMAKGLQPIYIGIGINSGRAVVGSMGSTRRSDYTAIGDTVNLASRLCHEARANEIIISGYTQEKLPADVFDLDTSVPAARVKGKEKAIPVAKVLDYMAEHTMGSR